MTSLLERNSEKKAFAFFAKKLFLFLLIIIFLDFLIGAIFRVLYFKQESGQLFRTTYVLDKTKADVIIFGSSRASHHYDPLVFEKRIPLEYYNAGRDGTYNLYHYAILKAILKRHKPKVIILEFGKRELMKSQISYDRLTALLPYYKDHPEIRDIVLKKSAYEKIKLLSNIYPYNSLLFSIIIGNSELNKKRMIDIKGFVPLTKTITSQVTPEITGKDYQIDSLNVWGYKSFIEACILNQISLYVVTSPYLLDSKKADTSIILAKKIADEYKIPFFDFSNSPSFLATDSLFSDPIHLNIKGASLFSNMVIDSLLTNRDSFNLPSTMIR